MHTETDGLLTEQVNPRTANIDTLSTREVLRLINNEDKTVAYAVEQELGQIASAVDAITAALAHGGRLIYIGAGTSGRLGILDAVECPPTFSTHPGQVVGLIAGGEKAIIQAVEGAEDDTSKVVEQLQALRFTAQDVLVGIAASGRTPYVIAGLEYANTLGAFTVAVSCTPDAAIGRVAKVAITPLVGPEVITGSTRLKAGTATKMVLNMLTTATMVRLGKVYGNLMVDVRPTNDKLLERAKRIVCEATGETKEHAASALEQASQNPKLAIVMLSRNCSAEEAKDYLSANGGFIREVINLAKKENNR